MKFFSIYDNGTENFNQPFMQPNAHGAIRIIKNEMLQDNSMLAKHPEDFDLYELGDFNPTTGEITPHRERVVRLRDLVNSKNNTQ